MNMRMTMSSHVSPLTVLLQGVVARARVAFLGHDAKRRKWVELPHKAEVHVQFVDVHTIRLAIARVGQTPDGVQLAALHGELDTVIKYWPEGNTQEQGERRLHPTDESGRYWLVTTLVIAHQPELL